MNIYLLMLLVGAAVFAAFLYLERRRARAVRAIANQLGLTYCKKTQPKFSYRDKLGRLVDSGINQSILCSKGRNRTLRNVIEGYWKGMPVCVGDYAYTTGSGKNKSTHRQTIVVLGYAESHVPEFSLESKNIFHNIRNLFGQSDINFSDYPDFSKRYQLTGPDELAIRDCFTSEVLTFFESHRSFCVESLGAALLYYKRGYRVKPQEWQKLMNTAYRVYSRF